MIVAMMARGLARCTFAMPLCMMEKQEIVRPFYFLALFLHFEK